MKQISIQLTNLMAAISAAFYRSKPADMTECNVGELRVHQNDSGKGISIDLYNFEGDGLPVCEGLDFDAVCPADMQMIHQRAWCITYDPDWTGYPVLVLCSDTTGQDDDFELNLDGVPEEVQRTITRWLQGRLPEEMNNLKQQSVMKNPSFILTAHIGEEQYVYVYDAASVDEVLERFWIDDYPKALAVRKEGGQFPIDVMFCHPDFDGKVGETYRLGFNAVIFDHFFDKGWRRNEKGESVKYTLEDFHKDVLKTRVGMDSEKRFRNDATSLFFYMWNCWSEEECKKAFADGDWNHFWKKWCGYSEECNRFGAVEHFYAELSNDNRDKLLKRACEMYDGSREKY